MGIAFNGLHRINSFTRPVFEVSAGKRGHGMSLRGKRTVLCLRVACLGFFFTGPNQHQFHWRDVIDSVRLSEARELVSQVRRMGPSSKDSGYVGECTVKKGNEEKNTALLLSINEASLTVLPGSRVRAGLRC